MQSTAPLPQMARLVRVLVVDDSPAFVTAVCRSLSANASLTIVGSAGDGRGAVKLTLELHPDLVIMDVSMPGMGGPEAAAMIKSLAPTVRVILMSIHEDYSSEFPTQFAAADTFIPKIGIQRRLWPEILKLFPAIGERGSLT